MDGREQVEAPGAGPLAVETDERAARADWRSSILGSILVVGLIGIWLMVSPVPLDYERPALPIVCGALVLMIAVVRLVAAPRSRTLALAQATAGALTVVAAFAAAETAGPTANAALMGAAVIVLSLVGMAASAEAPLRSRA